MSQADSTQTVYAYNDQPGALEQDTCQDLNNYLETMVSGVTCSGGVKTARLLDGLGQPTESRLFESGTGYISTQTVYDGLERGVSGYKSLPSGSGDGAVYNQPLRCIRRLKQTMTADGSVTTVSYLGNRTQTTVAAINTEGSTTKQTWNDGLGRMSEVVEDPAGPAFETDYKYTALDQLKTVLHGGETRSFLYDSLKRLKQATNPETGTITYGYDSNGNLTSRSDARGYVTLGYDALNRLTGKNYVTNTNTALRSRGSLSCRRKIEFAGRTLNRAASGPIHPRD